MSLDAARLLALDVTEEKVYTRRDTLLYALGVGLGSDPLDVWQLRHVHEQDLKALPTQALALGFHDLTSHYASAGLTAGRLLHGEQHLRLHDALPVEGRVRVRVRALDAIDKGPGRGLLFYYETSVSALDGRLLSTAVASTFCLDDGGRLPTHADRPMLLARDPLPMRLPDATCELSTPAQLALMHRLCGDLNPLHARPEVARRLGFERPPLHGRCTFGMAAHLLLRAMPEDGAANRREMREMRARLRAPFFPGETLRLRIWLEASCMRFDAHAVGREAPVLDEGRAVLTD